MNLITGATGFIGRHLARRLIEQGQPVRIICRAGSESKLPEPLREKLEIVHVDLARLDLPSERDALSRALQGASRIFHCAGHVSDWGSESQFRSLNVEATRILLEESAGVPDAQRCIRRFVHLSSIAAFGTPSPEYLDDDTPLGNGRDAYSKTKAEGEKLVFEFHEKTGLPVTVIRPPVVYGLGGTWLEEPLRMIEKNQMFLPGGGSGTCHPCYVENLIDAILLAADHPRAIGQAYIVGDTLGGASDATGVGEAISFREYFNAVSKIAGKEPTRRSIPLLAARAMATGFETVARLTGSSKRPLLTQTAIDMVTTKSRMSTKKIREELGFKPRWTFHAAMAQITRDLARKRLALPAGDFRAYIFDCDGTIADTMPLHYEAWLQALSPWKCSFPEDLFYAWAGRPGDRIVELLNEKYGLAMPPKEIFSSKEELYLKLLPKVRAIEWVRDQIDKRHGEIPFAVVSGSPRASVLKTLQTLGLTDRFETVLGCEDYARGKPDPEPFITAASRLRVAPEHCLVFEDADLGIEAARAAGMAYVKV